MKTKFDTLLVKLKQDVQLCEKEMMKINALISQTQQEIQSLIHKMEQIKIPDHGNLVLIQEIFENKKAFLAFIDATQERLSTLKEQKKQKEDEYKFHQLEFEKIQYLRQKEIQHKIKEARLQETKQLDEVASTRFYRQTGGKL